MDWRSHARTTGSALKNWFIAQCYDSLAVAVLWLVGLWIIGIPWAPLWAILGGVLQFIPNFGERYRQGETISTAFVESTINQVVSRRFVKKQQMQWTLRGAHLLLQTRTKVLNNELEGVFRRWYPQFRAQAA